MTAIDTAAVVARLRSAARVPRLSSSRPPVEGDRVVVRTPRHVTRQGPIGVRSFTAHVRCEPHEVYGVLYVTVEHEHADTVSVHPLAQVEVVPPLLPTVPGTVFVGSTCSRPPRPFMVHAGWRGRPGTWWVDDSGVAYNATAALHANLRVHPDEDVPL